MHLTSTTFKEPKLAVGRLPKDLALGLKASLPIAVSFAISFSALGALCRASGLTAQQSVAMTALVFAGPAQYAILSYLTSGAALPVILLSVLLINFRFFIMALGLVPVFKGTPMRWVLSALPMLSASTFAVTKINSQVNEGARNFRYYLGVCFGSFPVAVFMTGMGFVLSANLPSELTKTVPVILPIYFAVLLAKEWRQLRGNLTALVAFCLHPVLVTTISKDAATLVSIFLSAFIIFGFTRLSEAEVR